MYNAGISDGEHALMHRGNAHLASRSPVYFEHPTDQAAAKPFFQDDAVSFAKVDLEAAPPAATTVGSAAAPVKTPGGAEPPAGSGSPATAAAGSAATPAAAGAAAESPATKKAPSAPAARTAPAAPPAAAATPAAVPQQNGAAQTTWEGERLQRFGDDLYASADALQSVQSHSNFVFISMSPGCGDPRQMAQPGRAHKEDAARRPVAEAALRGAWAPGAATHGQGVSRRRAFPEARAMLCAQSSCTSRACKCIHTCLSTCQHSTGQHSMLQIYEFTTLHSDLQDRAALQGQVWTHTYYIVALVLKQLHPTCQMLHASISRIWRLRLASAAPLDQVQ